MSITLDQVTKRYQGSPVVNDVSVEVGEGEFFVLLGPSGSGKSTLLRAIAGLTGVDHGRVPCMAGTSRMSQPVNAASDSSFSITHCSAT